MRTEISLVTELTVSPKSFFFSCVYNMFPVIVKWICPPLPIGSFFPCLCNCGHAKQSCRLCCAWLSHSSCSQLVHQSICFPVLSEVGNPKKSLHSSTASTRGDAVDAGWGERRARPPGRSSCSRTQHCCSTHAPLVPEIQLAKSLFSSCQMNYACFTS